MKKFSCINEVFLFILFVFVSSISCNSMEETLSEILSLEPVMCIDGNNDLDHIFTAADVVVDFEGKIFVLDYVRMVFLVFGSEGEFLYEFGGHGEAPGEFSTLHFNFDIDNSGFVYAVDNWNRISIFSNDGSYLRRIEPNVGEIFDIAVMDTNRILVNAFPRSLQLIETSSIPAVVMLNSEGNVVREIGLIETDFEDLRRKMCFSCAIDFDQDNSIYYASLGDYNVAKYDSTGNLIWSITGPSSSVSYSVQHELGSTLFPIVWDLDVEQNQVFVLWAQGGNDRGYRVDVFDACSGDFNGYFYTQTPSEEKNMFMEVNGNNFYTIDSDYGIVYKYSMHSR